MQMGCLQLTYEPKLKIVHSHEAKSVQLWLSVDPLAEDGPEYSPYCYTFNDPINLTDPDGRWPDLPKYFKDLGKAIKQSIADDFSTYNKRKFDKDVIQPLKNGLKKLDNLLTGDGEKNNKQGGYDFRSDLKQGANSDQKQKRKGDRNTETADATGIDAASGLSDKTTDRKVKTVKDVAEKLKGGFGQGDNIKNAKYIYSKDKKSDTIPMYTYGGKDHTVQLVEKKVNGKIVKVEKPK